MFPGKALDSVAQGQGDGKINDCGCILVVDDDADFRGVVRELFRRIGYATVEAANAFEALRAAQRETPSLVLLKVELPQVSGYELCRELREEYGEQLPIIFVSADRVESIDRVAGLLIGADDYVAKPIELEDELLARVRRLLARPSASSGSTAGDGMRRGLTSREYEVLVLLAEGYTQKGIADELVISPSTVGTHIQRILAKLGVHSRGHAIALAYRVGLLDARVRD